MKVFVAGATGAIGRQLVPALVRAGHAVTGTSRSQERAAGVRAQGAEAVVVDALDAEALAAAVRAAAPEVVVHELTAITSLGNPRRMERDFADTNRLRTEGTRNLVAAARAAGARRLVAQSFAGWPYAREGGPVKTEEDRLDPDPPAGLRAMLEAIRQLEQAVLGAEGLEGLVLRYGGFYGPGTSLAEGGEHVEAVRARRFPIVAGGTGVWSFVHVEDAAEATVAAVERGAPGIYNVVDDDPAPVSEWVPALAEAAGAKPPWRVPGWVGRIAAGEAGLVLMTDARGASNEKAKRELGWQPRRSSWREGFREVVGGAELR